MIFKITYKLLGMEFSAEAENIAQAYECVRAIIKSDGSDIPGQERTLSNYMAYLALLREGKFPRIENPIFRVEVDRSDEHTQSLADALRDAETIIGKIYLAGGAFSNSLIEGYWERKKEREKRWGKGGIAK